MNYETRVDLTDGAAPPDLPPDGLEEDDARETRKRRLRMAIIIGVLAIIIAAALLHSGKDTADFAATQDQTTPVVTVISPGASTLQGVVNATGTLAARRELPVGSAGEGGRVVSVPVDAGDWVRAGQVLAVIDRSVQTEQAASNAAQIDAARADAQLAQANLDRALKLVDRGFISKADVDRLTATRDAAVAQVRVAEAQLAERRARNAQLNIVAPAAGLLLERNVEPGQVVTTGSGVLFSIARGGQMELLAEVGESELARISVGDSATVTPVGSDKSFPGQVWQIAPVINKTDRQGTARIALSYAPGLRPGGFATVQIDSGTTVAPRLPDSAILSDDKGSYVYIVDSHDKVVRRDVTLGMVSDEGIAIASGLKGDEKIVARAGAFLSPGQSVRPVAGGAAD